VVQLLGGRLSDRLNVSQQRDKRVFAGGPVQDRAQLGGPGLQVGGQPRVPGGDLEQQQGDPCGRGERPGAQRLLAGSRPARGCSLR